MKKTLHIDILSPKSVCVKNNNPATYRHLVSEVTVPKTKNKNTKKKPPHTLPIDLLSPRSLCAKNPLPIDSFNESSCRLLCRIAAISSAVSRSLELLLKGSRYLASRRVLFLEHSCHVYQLSLSFTYAAFTAFNVALEFLLVTQPKNQDTSTL